MNCYRYSVRILYGFSSLSVFSVFSPAFLCPSIRVPISPPAFYRPALLPLSCPPPLPTRREDNVSTLTSSSPCFFRLHHPPNLRENNVSTSTSSSPCSFRFPPHPARREDNVSTSTSSSPCSFRLHHPPNRCEDNVSTLTSSSVGVRNNGREM